MVILTQSFSPLRSVLHNLSCWSPKQKWHGKATQCYFLSCTLILDQNQFLPVPTDLNCSGRVQNATLLEWKAPFWYNLFVLCAPKLNWKMTEYQHTVDDSTVTLSRMLAKSYPSTKQQQHMFKWVAHFEYPQENEIKFELIRKCSPSQEVNNFLSNEIVRVMHNIFKNL